jgi:hypothetical protein
MAITKKTKDMASRRASRHIGWRAVNVLNDRQIGRARRLGGQIRVAGLRRLELPMAPQINGVTGPLTYLLLFTSYKPAPSPKTLSTNKPLHIRKSLPINTELWATTITK